MTDSADELIAYNTGWLGKLKRNPFFRMFEDGTLEDTQKRQLLLACVQVFARHFQTMILARQASCADDRYDALFRKHMQEELGHDDVLRGERESSQEVWDPVIEGAAAWFISRMTRLDNIEKLAVIHLVLETGGAYLGSVSSAVMRGFGHGAYFELHDELDDSHVSMAIDPIRRQSAETHARLAIILEDAWQMLDCWLERMESIVQGRVPVTLRTPGDVAHP